MKCQDKWSHSFYGGVCEWCGITQASISHDISKVDTNHLKQKKTPQKRITSHLQYETDQLITYLGVPVKEFPRFARYVKKLGVSNIHGIIKQIKEVDNWCREKNGKPLNKIGYFINKFTK